MTIQDKTKIATSFPEIFESFEPGLKLTPGEFEIFERGIHTRDMDEKWNIFVIDDHMFCARSWTNICIFKAKLDMQPTAVLIEKVLVNRDNTQYLSNDLKFDKTLFSKIIDFYLNRQLIDHNRNPYPA